MRTLLKPGKYALKYKHGSGDLYREKSQETHHTADPTKAQQFDADYLNGLS